jgi:Ca-activated chloride channel family protein
MKRNTKLTLAIFTMSIFMYACGGGEQESSNQKAPRSSVSDGNNQDYGHERNVAYSKTEESEAEMNPNSPVPTGTNDDHTDPQFNTESYNIIRENSFLAAINNPLSTFSIDVDNASYSNIRRFLNSSQLPPKDAVRIEEMVNYFNYDYTIPSENTPFSINTELSDCPWNSENKLVHIGLQGYTMPIEQLPSSNLVFLLDVSGSMNSPNKLGLLKKSFKMLTSRLSKDDQVAIVVYAGSSGVVLPSTSCNNEFVIMQALDRLKAGGSTGGAEGIELAYKIAKKNFVPFGNNRVILATDGDFNVGPSSDAELTRIIEEKRDEGIFLTVLGFGMGNYKDSKMEAIADNGNGNYFYIDDINESQKVLVDNLAGTLLAIAKDVKIQIEFNPTKVESYRLIGYENRVMANEDFDNDKKDAGELGAGHTVTALYEIVPSNGKNSSSNLKYQETTVKNSASQTDELFTVKFRYKKPDGKKSKLIVQAVKDQSTPFSETSNNFRFSAAVASFGMLLRGSEHSGNATYESTLELAEGAKGADEKGYRYELIQLIKTAQNLNDVAMMAK